MSDERLAIHGGVPCRTRSWPAWPTADADTDELLIDVLHGGRWTVTGNTPNGREPYEKRFARAFAEFNGVRHCVPVTGGSVSIIVALRALGIGFGDEVLVPALTWVGCAASILATGAIPIFVDIDSESLAMDPTAAAAAITERTAAILLVHPYCTLADLDRFSQLARASGVPLIEDCSQAHGAMWNGRRVGSFGTIGVFSMHETKVLTCGEGGAAITDNEELFNRMCQVRGDGRTYASHSDYNRLALEDAGDVLGHNFVLSEFHSAILLDRLGHLPAELARREENGVVLRRKLAAVGGVRPLPRPARADLLSYWRFVVRLELDDFGGWTVEDVAEALAAELGIFVIPVDPPIVDSVLYKPLTSLAAKASDSIRRRLDVRRFDVERARAARRTAIRMPHRMLLGDEDDMEDIARAFRKVKAQANLAPK